MLCKYNRLIVKWVLKIWIIVNKRHFIFLDYCTLNSIKPRKSRSWSFHKWKEVKGKPDIMSWYGKPNLTWRMEVIIYKSHPLIMLFSDWLVIIWKGEGVCITAIGSILASGNLSFRVVKLQLTIINKKFCCLHSVWVNQIN